MSLKYKRQFGWRNWAAVLEALPPIGGSSVLDLGCGIGDVSAELVARGARVIGVDLNEEFLREAQTRSLPRAEFRLADLREPLRLDDPADGIWCSFTAAYLPDLVDVLAVWSTSLRPGGWIALVEVDDLFGHEPLGARTKSWLERYVGDALEAKRYDFRMGRKLGGFLERSGSAVARNFAVDDREFSFRGPAPPDVVDSWRNRLDRMKLLRDFCGEEFSHVRAEFLACLTHANHRSVATVVCCIAHKPADGGAHD